MTEQVIMTDPVYAFAIGRGPPTVVVVHGGPGVRHDYLRPEFDRLARHARVIYYDQRGCGRSSGDGPLHWRQHVGDLHALIRATGAGKVILAGSSWGTALAAVYAWQYPEQVSGFILSGAFGWPSGERFHVAIDSAVVETLRVFDARVGRLVRPDSATVASFLSGPVDVGERNATRVDSATIAQTRAGELGAPLAARLGEACPGVGLAVWDSWADAPALESLTTVTAPAMILHGTGERDRTGALVLAGALPGARLVAIEDGGHDPWFAAPDEFFDHAGRFIREFDDR